MRKSARPGVRIMVMLACAVTLGAVIGCSSSSTTSTSTGTSPSSGGKPAYCAARADLQNAIKGFTSLNTNSGVGALKTQVTAVANAATALVNSAKGDFPNETSAIKSSVDSLKSSVQNLPANPSAGQVAKITADGAAVVASVTSFMTATSGKC
jgi:pectin methylesterase-like acyl-CoA thioesterase